MTVLRRLGCGHHFDGAPGSPTVPGAHAGVGWHLRPGQLLACREQAALLGLHGELALMVNT